MLGGDLDVATGGGNFGGGGGTLFRHGILS